MGCCESLGKKKKCLLFSLFLLILLAVVALAFYCLSGRKKGLEVTVEEGVLRGSVEKLDDGVYYSFKGIPYAQPPIGELRFKTPQPPVKWTGTRDASQHGNFCIQYDSRLNKIKKGSEDCLYLNVYSKNIKPDKPKPVLFWIHGGSFFMGSGNSKHYNPKFILESDDLVVVTINYRLEVLGFLSLGVEEAPGNIGLKDQLAALKWVNKNIGNFGGDKNNVTIAGCSAGADSVTLHMLSPQSKGLFHKAVAMSGTAFNAWGVEKQVETRTWQLVRQLGSNTTDPHEALQFLRNVPVEQLVNIHLPSIIGPEIDEILIFAPVVEKDFGNGEAFLIKSPREIIEEQSMNTVPLLIGTVDAEGIEVAQSKYYTDFATKDSSFFTPFSLKRKSQLTDEELGRIVKKFYFGNNELSEDTIQNFINAASDLFFVYDIYSFAEKMSSFAPVYYYQFQYENDRNMYKIWYNMTKYSGVCHADDLFYLFDSKMDPSIPETTEESLQFIRSYVKLWTNFIMTGKPTSDNQPLQWKPFTEAEKNYFIINNQMNSSINPEEKRMRFLKELHRLYVPQ